MLRWEMVLHAGDDRTWSWRRIAPDGTIEQSSSPHPDFGKVIADAVQHGFLPKEHDWIVRNHLGVTHFPAHKPPMLVGRNGDVVQSNVTRVANREAADAPPAQQRKTG